MRTRIESMLRTDASDEDLLDPSRFDRLDEERDQLVEELSLEERFLKELGAGIKTIGDYELGEELGRVNAACNARWR